MTKPRVFLVKSTRDDVSDARRFGDVVLIFGDAEPRPRLFSEDFAAEVVRRLETAQYDPEVDYFLVTGDLVSVTMVAAAIARESSVPPRALFFDKQVSEYRPLRLGATGDVPLHH
jgi:hypothetical protein